MPAANLHRPPARGRGHALRRLAAADPERAAALGVGALLVYGTLDMPDYGDPDAPVHTYMAPRFLEQSEQEVGVPNIVTAVLASYRGYDTFGEATVVFTAAVGVLLLLAGAPKKRRRGEIEPGDAEPATTKAEAP